MIFIEILYKPNMTFACSDCKAVFKCEQEDIKQYGGNRVSKTRISARYFGVKCPICSSIIKIWNDEEKERDRIRLLQYENLRKHFRDLVNYALGEDYYNEGMDVYTCDELSCRDLKSIIKRHKSYKKEVH